MKHTYFFTGAIVVLLTILSSCETESYEEPLDHLQQQDVSVSKISYKNLKANKEAVREIKNVITKTLSSTISQRVVLQ